MKYLMGLLAISCFGLSAVKAQDATLPKNNAASNKEADNFEMKFTQPTSITFPCGNGSVKVSLVNGNVEYTGDCNPSEAGKAFWMAVTQAYPDVRLAIKQQP